MSDQSLMRILSGEPKKKEFTIGAFKATLKVLTQEEMDNAMILAASSDVIARSEAEKRCILSYALVSVNDLPIASFNEVKALIEKDEKMSVVQAVYKVLGGMDTIVVSALFGKYLALLEEERKEKAEISGFF